MFLGHTLSAQDKDGAERFKSWYTDKTESYPVVNSDNSATFRYYAPRAKSVEITGDFLPAGNRPAAMKTTATDSGNLLPIRFLRRFTPIAT